MFVLVGGRRQRVVKGGKGDGKYGKKDSVRVSEWE